MIIQSPPLTRDRLGAINMSPLSEAPFNRWKVLPYHRVQTQYGIYCFIIRLCISVLGKAREDSQTAKQNIKQQESKEQGLKHLSEGGQLVIHNIYCLEIAFDCWKEYKSKPSEERMSPLSKALSCLTDKK